MKPHVIAVDPDIDFIYAMASHDIVAQQGTFEEMDRHVLDMNSNACVVNPGNGLGIMGAGMAGAIRTYFGESIAKEFQHTARRKFGSLPAPTGYTMLVYTAKPDTYINWCAYTVTMEQPGMRLSSNTRMPYHCMKNVLSVVDHHNKHYAQPIRVVLVSGLGTGVGRVQPELAAVQMAQAIHEWNDD
jgi:O-acetyl-ADP-ribose deacetylase (regulator of RNase III)